MNKQLPYLKCIGRKNWVLIDPLTESQMEGKFSDLLRARVTMMFHLKGFGLLRKGDR
jgi:hypothetical protein